VTAAFLLRVGLAAGLAAAGCDVVLLLVAWAQGWDVTPPGAAPVQPLGVVLVCLVVAALASLATYAAARVTKHPSLWVGVVGVGLLLASVQDLPPTLQIMHAVAAAWIIGWLARAVHRGTHLA
jgi:Na+/phosphate symporter